jgi:hypothetical protein
VLPIFADHWVRGGIADLLNGADNRPLGAPSARAGSQGLRLLASVSNGSKCNRTVEQRMKLPIQVQDMQLRQPIPQRRSIGAQGVRPQSFFCDAACGVAEVACNAACDLITDGVLAGACYVGCAAVGAACRDAC